MAGRISNRFEVGHPMEGLIATEATKAEAFATAVRWATSGRTGYPDALRQVRVYDSMAHSGASECYATQDGKSWRPIRNREEDDVEIA